MLLKRLEAYGFKSFADKIEIEFDKGITAIVGPNGSGKSNITDAIRWVLGEQSIRSLRGNKAEDIIFAGSSDRKQSGIAEVSVTFDNTDGRLPLDFQEIAITRRLFRSGESEFYINKARCRLKDIYGLFADTGIGRDSISVISQNKVDEVLNAKPEDRRLLFEECAGITKYRDRKKEAVKKLETTKQNALRINDIIAEIEKQLEPLSHEAEKTGRYNDIKAKYDKYKLSYILCSYEKSSAEGQKYTEQIEQLNHESAQLNINLDAIDGKIASLEETIAAAEKQLADKDHTNRKIAEELDRNRNKCTVLEERIRQNSHSLNSLKSTHDDTASQKKITEIKLAALKDNLVEITAEKSDLETKLAQTNAAIKTIENKITAKEASLDSLKVKSEQHRQSLEKKQRQIILLKHDIEEKQRNFKERHASHTALQDEYNKLLTAINAAEAELRTINTDKENTNIKAAALKKQFESANEDLRVVENSCSELSQKADRIKERIKILSNMQKAYEGFGSGTKRVLTARDYSWHKGICGSVAELINVQQPYITAVEVALGGNIQNVITENTDTAKAAIEFLKEQKLGRVTFLPISTVKPRNTNRVINGSFAGFINYADKLVNTDNKYRPIIESLLGRTVVVDNIDNALILAKKENYSIRIVTLTGEIIHAGGAVSGGSIKREISFLNRDDEIKQLTDKNENIISTLLLEKTKQGQLLSNLSHLEAEINTAEKKLQQYSIIYTEKNTKYTHLQTDSAKLEKNISLGTDTVNNLEAEIKSLSAKYEEQSSALHAEESTGIVDNDSSVELEHDLLNYRNEQKSLQQVQLQQTSDFAAIEQTLTGSREKLDLIKSEYERCEAFLANNHDEQARLQTAVDESINELKELQASSKNLQQLHTAGRQEYDDVYKDLMDKRVKNKDCSLERRNLTENINKLQENIHQLDIKVTKISFEAEQCEKNLQEQYNLSPQAALSYKEDMPEGLLLKNIKQMQSDMQDIGAVNPNAINEYNTLNDRYQFLKTQMQDLITAKDNLQQIIDQMDITMTKQFKEAFECIEKYFNDTFSKLFGGGKAQLLLTDKENILSSGVEIMVQAPGKKNQNLALLSGGERTLTVIALLFSFLQYSPAPFSVLDEIDAPLDEANIKRFGVFLKNYAEQTQFIIVTHRKGTMESADVMYGVTMESAGISKIISVKMEESEEQ